MSRRRDPQAWGGRDYRRGDRQGRAQRRADGRVPSGRGCLFTLLTLPWALLAAREPHQVEQRSKKQRRQPADYALGHGHGRNRGRSQKAAAGPPPDSPTPSAPGPGCLMLLLLPFLLLFARDQPRSGPAGKRAQDPKHRDGDWHVDRDTEPESDDKSTRGRGERPGTTRHRGGKK